MSTAGLFERFGPEIVRDAPLCESATVGFGIGLAISGVRAIVEVEFMDFLGVAMDQIVNQAAKMHYTTGGKLNVPLVIRAPGGLTDGHGLATFPEPRVLVHAHPRHQGR